jgi:hypothetical protein
MKVEGEFDYYQTRCEPWTRSLLQSWLVWIKQRKIQTKDIA